MFYVITGITDKKNASFNNFFRLSLALNNLNTTVIIGERTEKSTIRDKDYALKKYLQNLNDDDIILYTDAYDVVFMSNEDEIVEKFQKTKKGILFSGETNCWPDINLSKKYPKKECGPYKYLNGGGFIGRVGIIKELLNRDSSSCDNSDFYWSSQYFWSLLYLSNKKELGLDIDTEGDIFCTFFNPEIADDKDESKHYSKIKKWFKSNFEIKKGRMFNKITETWPCHAHFNGQSRCLMDYDILSMIYSQIPGSKKLLYRKDVNKKTYQ